MAKREECRNCGAKLRHDKTSDQYDPEYCSGLCRKKDGSPPYVKTAEEQAMVVKEAKLIAPASFKDYEKNVGGRYVRRNDPEKLNWGKPMSDGALLQAGFRANREPIKGDWDYQEEETVLDKPARDPNEWDALRARAKGLGISIHGKNKDVLTAEVMNKEAEDANITD